MPTSPVQRGPRSKQCGYCDRKFSKAEHLKRHQRTHTGERPYTCQRCNKSFSRSDVLIRHLKNHPRPCKALERNTSEGDFVDANGAAPNPDGQVAPELNRQPMQDIRQHDEPNSLIDPALEKSMEGHVPNSTSDSLPSGLDHLAFMASRQKWDHDTIDPTMTAGASTLPEMDASQHWNPDSSGQNYAHYSDVNYELPPMQSEANFHASPHTASTYKSPYNFGTDFYPGQNKGISPGIGETGPDGVE